MALVGAKNMTLLQSDISRSAQSAHPHPPPHPHHHHRLRQLVMADRIKCLPRSRHRQHKLCRCFGVSDVRWGLFFNYLELTDTYCEPGNADGPMSTKKKLICLTSNQGFYNNKTWTHVTKYTVVYTEMIGGWIWERLPAAPQARRSDVRIDVLKLNTSSV